MFAKSVDFSARIGNVGVVSYWFSENRKSCFVEGNLLDVHVSWGGGYVFVMLLHSVVCAPKLGAIGRIEEGCVSGAVDVVSFYKNGGRMLYPVFRHGEDL